MMKGIGLLIRKGIGLLIRKGIGLLIMKGIGLLIVKGIYTIIRDKSGQVRTDVKYYISSTVSPTLFKFGPLPKPACSFLTVPRSKP